MNSNLFGPNGLAVQLSRADAQQLNNKTERELLALILANTGGALPARQRSVTLSLDTSIYAAGDVLAATQEITEAVRARGFSSVLDQITVLDKDDQTAADMTFVFFSANVALGTENAAPNISDLNAEKVLGVVKVVAADFVDVGGAKIGTKSNIKLLVTPDDGTSIFFGVITAGTPTQTAAGIVVNFGFIQE